jgi:hypothetical protein
LILGYISAEWEDWKIKGLKKGLSAQKGLAINLNCDQPVGGKPGRWD